MSDLAVTSRIRPRPGVVFRPVQDEAVLLDTRSGSYFALNETGAFLWQALGAEGASLAELEAALRAAFGEAVERLRGDLEAWVKELQDHQLLEVLPPRA